MIALVAGLALAGPKPPTVDTDEVGKWETASAGVLAGPAGCWDFTGEVQLTATTHVAPGLFGGTPPEEHTFSGPFEGRLDDGTWLRFEYRVQPTDPDDPEVSVPIFPLIGVIDASVVNLERLGRPEPDDDDVTLPAKDGEDEITIRDGEASLSVGGMKPLNLLSDALDEWAGSVATSLAQWDAERDGVMLLREVPIRDEPRAPVAALGVFFPDGGVQPTELSARWPRTVKVGTWPLRVTLKDAQMHVRTHPVGEHVLPLLESASLIATAMGFTVGYDQTLVFQTATPCAPVSPPEGA